MHELLLDSAEVDRTRLAEALRDILGIDSKTGNIVLKPGFNSLKTRQKVLAFLLGMKVSGLLGKLSDESILPKAIQDGTGLPKGTVNPKFSELKEEKLVTSDKTGKYHIAPHQLSSVLDDLKKSAEK